MCSLLFVLVGPYLAKAQYLRLSKRWPRDLVSSETADKRGLVNVNLRKAKLDLSSFCSSPPPMNVLVRATSTFVVLSLVTVEKTHWATILASEAQRGSGQCMGKEWKGVAFTGAGPCVWLPASGCTAAPGSARRSASTARSGQSPGAGPLQRALRRGHSSCTGPLDP